MKGLLFRVLGFLTPRLDLVDLVDLGFNNPVLPLHHLIFIKYQHQNHDKTACEILRQLVAIDNIHYRKHCKSWDYHGLNDVNIWINHDKPSTNCGISRFHPQLKSTVRPHGPPGCAIPGTAQFRPCPAFPAELISAGLGRPGLGMSWES